MIEEIYVQAKQILLDNREKLDKLAKILIDREVIFREDVEEIFGPRQWEDSIEGIKDMVTPNTENNTTEVTSTSEDNIEYNVVSEEKD